MIVRVAEDTYDSSFMPITIQLTEAEIAAIKMMSPGNNTILSYPAGKPEPRRKLSIVESGPIEATVF